MTIAIILLILGLIILIAGAESLVRGSSSLAKKLGIPPLVIGLTIVAFGTSAPELIVNLVSAFKGSSDIAIGNIVGSNIANILLILGISALIRQIHIKDSTVFKEIPLALLAMILVLIMGNDVILDKTAYNGLTRTDGLSLIGFFLIFMFYVYGISKQTKEEVSDIKIYSYPISTIFTITGLVALFYGGNLLVENAIILAKTAGLSEALIGLTIVAVGTSLPEMATSIIATMHKQYDIAIGNIVGSNIFNVFWILGLTATILQLPFNASTNSDVIVGIMATFLLFLFMFIGNRKKLDRWQGVMFIIIYIIYIVYLIYRG